MRELTIDEINVTSGGAKFTGTWQGVLIAGGVGAIGGAAKGAAGGVWGAVAGAVFWGSVGMAGYTVANIDWSSYYIGSAYEHSSSFVGPNCW